MNKNATWLRFITRKQEGIVANEKGVGSGRIMNDDDSEKKFEKRAINRERQARARATETPERRALRLARDRERHRLSRMLETPERRTKRLEADRMRHMEKRCGSGRNGNFMKKSNNFQFSSYLTRLKHPFELFGDNNDMSCISNGPVFLSHNGAIENGDSLIEEITTPNFRCSTATKRENLNYYEDFSNSICLNESSSNAEFIKDDCTLFSQKIASNLRKLDINTRAAVKRQIDKLFEEVIQNNPSQQSSLSSHNKETFMFETNFINNDISINLGEKITDLNIKEEPSEMAVSDEEFR